MNKFDKFYESIIGQMAYKDAILRDVQIADTYIWLSKSGKTFTVKTGKGTTINRTNMKIVYSSKSEDSARNYFHKLRSKIMSKVDK